MTVEGLVARRHARRLRLIEEARGYADRIDATVDVRAVVVFGAVARGDFNDRSDIDVLVVATDLPEDPLRRLARLGADLPPCLSVVAWTPAEWVRQRGRGNPIASEAQERGVWIRGSAGEAG